METYRKIDALRGEEPRSALVQGLVERELARRERASLVETLQAQYTEAVCHQTLAINDEFPVHEG